MRLRGGRFRPGHPRPHLRTARRQVQGPIAPLPGLSAARRAAWALAERWHDLIDVDAGRIATGQATIEDIGWELFHLILDVASGRKQTWADRWGLRNAPTLFNPAAVT
ncbi:MAG TPA: hypothetical protein VD978_14410 [Azospirillum sp.]|nr:hypothetical protein [Azospirillum sp.]